MPFKKGNKYRFKKGQTHYPNGNRIGVKKGNIPWNKGLTKEKDSRIDYDRPTKFLGIKGKKSPNWKGGVTPINQAIRTSDEYKQWRKSVFERDGYKCRVCKKSGYLHAHHILPFAKFQDMRLVRVNGLTVCRQHHQNFRGTKA